MYHFTFHFSKSPPLGGLFHVSDVKISTYVHVHVHVRTCFYMCGVRAVFSFHENMRGRRIFEFLKFEDDLVNFCGQNIKT